MGDSLQTLPTDQQPHDVNEKLLLEEITKESDSGITRLFKELRLPLIAGIVFLLLSLPQVNSVLTSTIPYLGKSQPSMIFFKTFCFVLILLILSMVQRK